MFDLNSKVTFQTSEKESRKADDGNNIDIVMIYENCYPEGRTAPKSQDNTTETTAVNVSPEKRTLLRAAAVFLGLSCLVLLVAVLVVLVIQDKNNWNRLWGDNAKLTTERDELQRQKNLLKAANNNLTNERDELQKQIVTARCPDYWILFGKSCYSFSTSKKNWTESKKFCEDQDAHLVIISNTEEQKFVSSFKQRVWIGLTDEETEGVWKWVDGTEVNGTYWGNNQPDSYPPGENCGEINIVFPPLYNWNDMKCILSSNFICEKIL